MSVKSKVGSPLSVWNITLFLTNRGKMSFREIRSRCQSSPPLVQQLGSTTEAVVVRQYTNIALPPSLALLKQATILSLGPVPCARSNQTRQCASPTPSYSLPSHLLLPPAISLPLTSADFTEQMRALESPRKAPTMPMEPTRPRSRSALRPTTRLGSLLGTRSRARHRGWPTSVVP